MLVSQKSATRLLACVSFWGRQSPSVCKQMSPGILAKRKPATTIRDAFSFDEGRLLLSLHELFAIPHPKILLLLQYDCLRSSMPE
jgi:hypothetical protein